MKSRPKNYRGIETTAQTYGQMQDSLELRMTERVVRKPADAITRRALRRRAKRMLDAIDKNPYLKRALRRVGLWK